MLKKIDKQIMEAIGLFTEGAMSSDIMGLVNTSSATLYKRLNFMVAVNAIIEKQGEKPAGKSGPAPRLFFLNPNFDESKPVAAPQTQKTKAKPETNHGVVMEAMREEIAALKEWKRNAIARYPDLAVSAETLKAREIIAE